MSKIKNVKFKLLILVSLIWLFCVSLLSSRWVYSLASDSYQYISPFCINPEFFRVRLPLLNEFTPYSGTWGSNWPAWMLLKSLIYGSLPFTIEIDFIITGSMLIASSFVLFITVSQIKNSSWFVLFLSLSLLFDKIMYRHCSWGRAEPLAALLCMIMIAICQNNSKYKLGLFSIFLLLPVVHPVCLMISGGLALIYAVYPRFFLSEDRLHLRFYPLFAQLLGVAMLILYFIAQPDAYDQMLTNLQVQSEIYSSATRYTFFKNYLAEYSFGLGFVIHGLGIAISGYFCIKVICSIMQNKNHNCNPSSLLASAIVIAMPLIGFLFKTDNYSHFVISAPASLYLLSQMHDLMKKLNYQWIGLGLLVVVLLFALSNGLVPLNRFYKYLQAGMPNYFEERVSILKKYDYARRIYIPPNMWAESAKVFPDKAICYKFPMPMLAETRKDYEKYIYKDVLPGDILIIDMNGIAPEGGDRFGMNPVMLSVPPNDKEWKLISCHERKIPGRVVTGWNLKIYEKQ